MTGIEPALSAWEADVLPLNYTRVITRSAVVASRIEVPGVIVASLIRALLPPPRSMITVRSQFPPVEAEQTAIQQ